MLESWPRAVEMLTRAGLEAQRAFLDVATTELRYSAVQLLRELEDQQRRADDEHNARLKAERTIERLERELAEERERAAAMAQAQANQPPAVNVVQRDEEWAVVREDAKRASRVFSTKRQAVQRAKEIARREGAEVQIEPA